MDDLASQNSISVRLISRRAFQAWTIAATVLLSVAVTAGEANAQFYRGFRHRGPLVVAPPILPTPYWSGVWPSAPVVVAPPSSVRVVTPYFSMNLAPAGVVPPGYPTYEYRYEAYRPSYDGRYHSLQPAAPSYGYGAAPPEEQSYGRYRSGAGGGIPDLTQPRSFSPEELRAAAETLYESLSRRPNDGDVWLKYLQPQRIIAAVDSGELSPSIAELHSRYVGVTMNSDLAAIMQTRGFGETLQLLGMWIERDGAIDNAAESDPIDSTAEEILPSPLGQADDE